jgi:UDP-N-acetylmuramate--alanine ligase
MYNPSLHFFFTGIGGIGMSGIAEVLLRQGFKVSGSDIAFNDSCKRLSDMGAIINIGHKALNLPPDASLLVYSSAVKKDNPELLAAQERKIPVVPRAQVLAELMRLKHGIAVAGSHGKTSTTSFIAHMLHSAGLDPTVVIGGKVNSIGGSGARLGKGSFLVAESDESDRSFLLLRPTIAVVTNIDSEHLDAYSSMAELEESFKTFINSVPFYGLAALCTDDPRLQKISANYERRQITFGLGPNSDIRATDISAGRDGMSYSVLKKGEKIISLTLPMHGYHMVSNSLGAVAVGLELGLSPDQIKHGLESFPGVGRRLELIAEVNGVEVMSDYGHHPTEIRATIGALRQSRPGSNIHVVFQPHRYSRTKSCFVDFVGAFKDCDAVYVTEIYSASEDPIPGVTGEILKSALDHPDKKFIGEPKNFLDKLPRLNSGDVVLCLGAGSIGQLPHQIVQALAE